MYNPKSEKDLHTYCRLKNQAKERKLHKCELKKKLLKDEYKKGKDCRSKVFQS